MQTMEPRKNPRMFRIYDKGGGYYSITMNTYRRLPLFNDPELRQALRDAMRTVKELLPFQTHAFVLLPDHIHWILSIEDDELSKRIGLIKALTTKFYGKQPSEDRTKGYKNARRHSIWQPRFYEKTIRSEKQLYDETLYIYTNPVHHGHCKKVGDWPWSSFHRDVRLGVVPESWAHISMDKKITVRREDR